MELMRYLKDLPDREGKQDSKLMESKAFYEFMNKRRSIREYAYEEISDEILLECVKTAGTAPSGANRQPWFFAIVKNPEIKRKIREAAEQEEFEFYNRRADDTFLDDLSPFKTDWRKSHLEKASALIVIFTKNYDMVNGEKLRCYYPRESVGIATGMLITAFHKLGYGTLTHTPNPMSFLTKILDRPPGEKPYLILAVGKKAEKQNLPDITRKSISDISKIY